MKIISNFRFLFATFIIIIILTIFCDLYLVAFSFQKLFAGHFH